MQVEALKVFCDVVSLNSFSLAAKENGITQSAASQAIHKLEDHFKVRLIDRSHRPWVLTAEGKIGFARSREVLDAYYRLEQDVEHFHTQHQQELRVAAIYSVGPVYLNALLQTFQANHPEIRIHIEYLHPDDVLAKTLENTIDLGVMAFPPSRRDLVVQPWLEEEMVLTCAKNHPFAAKASIQLQEIAGQHVVSYDSNLVVGRKIEKQLRDNQVEFEVVLRFDNIEAIKRAVENSSHVAIVPKTTVKREVETSSLVAIPLEDSRLVRPLGIVYRRGYEPTAAAATFITVLQNVERS